MTFGKVAAGYLWMKKKIQRGAQRRNRIILWSVIIGSAVLIGGLSHAIHLKTIHDWAAHINGWLLFALMAFLPVVGVPMSILGIMAGAKFGPWYGLAVTAGAVAINMALSWWIMHSWLRKAVDRLLEKTHYKKPSLEVGEYAGVCMLTILIPGPSYALKNYFLAISNLPFGVYFGIGLPVHVFAMSPGILFGNFSGAMTGPKIAFLVAYTLLLVGASWFFVRKMKGRKKGSR